MPVHDADLILELSGRPQIVGIDERDELSRGCRKRSVPRHRRAAGADCRGEPPNVWMTPGKRCNARGRIVGRAIVCHEHFQRGVRLTNDRFKSFHNSPGRIERGDNHRHARARTHKPESSARQRGSASSTTK